MRACYVWVICINILSKALHYSAFLSSPASLVQALTQHDLCVQCAPKYAGSRVRRRFMFSHLLRSVHSTKTATDGRGQTRRPFPDRRRVGRDLSALVTQGRPLYRARRCNGTRGCVEPAEGLMVSALLLYNLIVPLKGQTIRSRGNMQASAWAFRFRFE